MTQITETTNEGLKRKLEVVVPRADLDSQFNERLNELKGQAVIKGFRKGKVPTTHLKKLYGQSLMAEVLQKAVEDTSVQALRDRKERPAAQPKIDLPEDKEEIAAVMSGKADLSYSMSFEVIPDIEIVDFASIKLEKLVAVPSTAEVDKALNELAERSTNFEVSEDRAAEKDDRLTIDFAGKIGGEPFDGGTGQDMHLVIGQGGFIPGFEDQLIGAKAGDERLLKVTFPEEYQAKDLAGKDAEFDVTVKEVARSVKPSVDDELAKTLGAENLEKLTEMVKSQLSEEFIQMSRAKLKGDLLDQFEKLHSFELPPTLVESEFDSIWQQIEKQLADAGKTFEDEGKTEESAREEYKTVASRRVRLGLVIGEIGEKNEIKTTDEEVQRAVMDEARRYPGQEQFVYEYYKNTPGALGSLRAPIYENKVIDLVLELVSIEEKTVTSEELTKALNDDDEAKGGDKAGD